MQVKYLREAEIELIDAMLWYEQQKFGLSDELAKEIQLVEAQIAEAPMRWPEFAPGFRKLNTRRFPYRLIYRILPSVVEIVAVMHHSRHPDYWRSRVK